MKRFQWLFSSLHRHSRRLPSRRRQHMAAERLEERCVLTTSTWATALGGSEKDVPIGITATSDGGYAVVGNTESFNAENGDLWLTRFDSAGSLLWTRQYGQSLNVALRGTGDQPFRSFTYDRATDIETTESGGFRISGYSEFAPGNAKIGWAMEVDSAGVVVAMAGNTFIAADQYTSLSNGTIGGNSIVYTPTSYRFVATIGDVRYGGLLTETTLSQLSSDGVVVGSQGVLNGQTLVASPSGGAVVFGAGESGVSITKTPTDGMGNSFYGVASVHYAGLGNQATYSVIRKLATDFSPVWEVSLPGDTATSIRALSDGGFVVALISNRASITNGSSSNVMLVKLDAAGEQVWAKTYGGLGTEGFLDPFCTTIDLVVTTDGFAFTTSTNSFGTNDANTSSLDYWIVKTDLDGNIPIMTGVMRDVTAEVDVSPFVGSFGTGVFQNLGPNVGPTDPTFSTFYFYAENDPGPVYTPIERHVAYGGPLSVATVNVDVVPRVQSVVDYNAGSFKFISATYETSEDEDVFTDGVLTEPRDFVNIVVARTDATHGAYGVARVNYSVTRNGSTSSGDAAVSKPSGGIDGGTAYLEFANGETSQAFRVYGFLDNDFDPGDSITITLSDPDLLNGAVVGALASTTITILNTNPAPGTVQFSAASYTVDENKQSVTVTVTRTNPSETDMQVSYAVIGGTAAGGNAGPADYGNGTTSGTLFFSSSYNGLGQVVSNETSKTFTIPIFDDPDVEGDETIQLQLSNPTNGGLLGSIATTTVTIHDIQPVPQTIVPKFNGKIAFVRSSNIGGNSPDLIIMNPNGSSETNITNSVDVQEMSPAWSPDGSKLAYVAFGFVGPVDITGINVINVDGTGRVQLTQNPSDAEPTWSPDGTRIAFVRYDNGKQLMVMNADGSNVESILADSYIGQPRWSPDGTRIAYEGRSVLTDADAIFEIGTDGFGKHMLFPFVGSSINSATDASYTPNGIQMVFRGVDLSREGRTDGIYRANVDGTGTPERLADGEFQLFLSPDGSRLAFGSTAGSFPRIVLSNLNGTQVVNVTDGSGGDRDPVWQPLLFALPPDTQAPTVLSVTPSTVTINDDFIGTGNFSLTVVFSEGMNTSVAPTLSFPVENPNSTLSFNAGESGWLYGSTTYVAKYDVADANKTLPNIDVRVSGGQDLAGNSHVTTTFSNKFGLEMAGTFADMTPPTVTAFERFNPLAIQTTASTLVFSVSFSESVDESTVDAADFSVNGSTATITSVTPAEGTFGLSFDVTVSGGNLASFLGAVGLDVRLTADILDTVGLPLTHVGPFVDEVYQHSPSAPNRVPNFTKGANQTVLEDSGAKSVTSWAKAIGAGTGDTGQTLDFIVTNNNNALFRGQPFIAANGTLTFTAATNANGTATVTVRIHDDGGTAAGGVDTSAAQTFTITVTSVNDVPTATVIAPQTINEDTTTGPIAFTVGDVESPAANLILKALSSTNTKLIPLTGIALGGSGANRTVTVTPVANQFGSSTIAFTIKDANGGVLTQNVLITVTPINDAPPTISNILDVTTLEDKPTAAIKFTVDDVDDKLVNLNAIIVTATSSNTALVPNAPANIVLGGSLGARTIQLKPLADQFGTTTITVTATDSSGATATDTFDLTVTSVNDAPRVTVATLTVPEFTTNDSIVGTVVAADPDAGDTVTAFAITAGNTGTAFKIGNDGVIRVNDATKIDYEVLRTYALTIKATDNHGLAGSKVGELGPITINVENQAFALTVPALDSDNTVTVSKIGNNLIARRGLIDVITPTPLEDITSLTITGGTAKDTVVLDASLNSAGSPATHSFTGQILVNGNGGNDTLDASKITVATFGIVFDGGADHDTALGGSGNETLTGGDGNDSLNGGAGNDLLTGGKGDDQLLGGTGNDTYAFGDTDTSETDTLTEVSGSGSGTDTLNFSTLTTAVTVDLNSETSLATHTNRTIKTSATGTTKLAPNFENVIGGIGDDSILGNAVANSLLGGAGQDTIKGGVGNDSINGGAGNDAIRGDDGNDQLNGGADNDVIIGGVGSDIIHGDEGDDTTIGGLGTDQVFGDAGTDFGLGGRGGPARGGTGVKDTGDVLNASLETINEAFATIFVFE